MKSTRSGQKWAHVSCALWIPEVSIGCVEKMEPITKISSIPVSCSYNYTSSLKKKSVFFANFCHHELVKSTVTVTGLAYGMISRIVLWGGGAK